MKKIFTLFAFLFFAGFVNAQQVSITIDTIYYLPANPSVGDNITLVLSGSANCHFVQQGPAFIADTGHFILSMFVMSGISIHNHQPGRIVIHCTPHR